MSINCNIGRLICFETVISLHFKSSLHLPLLNNKYVLLALVVEQQHVNTLPYLHIKGVIILVSVHNVCLLFQLSMYFGISVVLKRLDSKGSILRMCVLSILAKSELSVVMCLVRRNE